MDVTLIIKIVSPIIATITSVVAKKILETKPQLITYLVHAAAIPLTNIPNNPQVNEFVNSHSIVIRNVGKKTANNIRVGHYTLPTNFQLQPNLSYQVTSTSNNGAEILIPTLVPSEQITISYLYFHPLYVNLIHSYTKCDEGLAKFVDITIIEQPKKVLIITMWLLMVIGLSVVINYLLLWLFHFTLI